MSANGVIIRANGMIPAPVRETNRERSVCNGERMPVYGRLVEEDTGRWGRARVRMAPRLFLAGNRFEAVVIRDEQTASAHALDETLAHEAGDVAADGLGAQAHARADVGEGRWSLRCHPT